MSYPKAGKFHSMSATVEYPSDNVIRLISYWSIVADYNTKEDTITLYPRWCYSRSTTRQVSRFINECVGYYNSRDLHAFAKQSEIDNVILFSNEYPQGR